MTQPATQTRMPNATRTLLAVVDSARDEIDAVLEQGWQATTPAELGSLVEDLVDDALHDRRVDAATTLPVENPAVFALGVALAAIRVERATPFKPGPDDYDRRTNVSVEHPLQSNPGSSALFQRLRALYQRALTALFDADPDITRYVARVILSPTETATPVRDASSESLIKQVAPVTADGTEYVAVPESAATQWCRIKPEQRSVDVPALKRRSDTDKVLVPVTLVREKFAAYAKFGFERLVHRAFHIFRDWRYAKLTAASWRVEKQINDVYVRNAIRRLYGDRRYSTSSTTRPAGPQRTGFRPVTHSRQLATIVDVIRASDLAFSKFHTASEIYERATGYYPPPHRPPNTLWSVNRISGVLQSAAAADTGTNNVVECRTHNDGAPNEYRIAAPRPTPLYTMPADATSRHRWDAYRVVRMRHAAEPLPADATLPVGTRQEAGTTDDPLVSATATTHRFAAAQPHKRELTDIGPAVHPAELELDVTLTEDDVTFLTRAVTGLNGLIAGETLRDGMRQYTRTADGELDVDPETLVELGLVDVHDEPYPTVYTVPREVADTLGLEYVKQEGYAEETPSETALHKYGVALLAAWIAQRDGVDTVVRYARLWRFDLDVDQETLQAHVNSDVADTLASDLRQRRLDVVGLDDGTPVYAGEVQLDHNKSSRVRRNWAKLRYVAESGATAMWLMPDFDALSSVVSDLQTEHCLPDTTLPDTERVSVWQDSFDTHDLYNPGFAAFSTFRSLYPEVTSA